MSTSIIKSLKAVDISRRAVLRGSLAMTALWALPSIGHAHEAEKKQTGSSVGDDSNMTMELAQFIVNTAKEDIPEISYEQTKIIFLDTLGCALAGKDEPLVKKLLALSEYLGGKEQSSIFGHNVKTSVVQAALINGAATHALDFDDSSSKFWGHPSASIIPSLLALGESENKSGQELLTAYLVGLKVGMTLADCVGKEMYTAGFHNTSTLGIMGASAACAHLLNLDLDQTVNALAIAATQTFGLKASFGTMCKPFHAGHAAEGAVTAVLLARDGFTGSDKILEGKNGLFQAFGGEVNDLAMGTLGRTWEVDGLSQKYHASCHWTHSPLVASLAIQKAKGIKAQDIQSIEIITSEIALATANIRIPKTGLQGKFSIPYCAANALVTGKTGLAGFTDDAVKNKEIISLIQKITTRTHPKADPFQARVIITSTGGDKYTEDADVFKNLPEFKEGKKSAIKKYTENTSPVIGKAKTQKVLEMIMKFDTVKDVGKLLDQISS